jgi:hypothetical protein
MRRALKLGLIEAPMTSANGLHRLLRPAPTPAIELAGFDSVSPYCFPVIERSGVRMFGRGRGGGSPHKDGENQLPTDGELKTETSLALRIAVVPCGTLYKRWPQYPEGWHR